MASCYELILCLVISRCCCISNSRISSIQQVSAMTFIQHLTAESIEAPLKSAYSPQTPSILSSLQSSSKSLFQNPSRARETLRRTLRMRRRRHHTHRVHLDHINTSPQETHAVHVETELASKTAGPAMIFSSEKSTQESDNTIYVWPETLMGISSTV